MADDWKNAPANGRNDGIIRIGSYEALLAFAARVNGGEYGLNAVLTADIQAADRKWTPIGEDIEHVYCGVFDGRGHSITGLSNDRAEKREFAGLFGCSEGTVRNTELRNASIRGSNSEGGIVGESFFGSVENCRVNGSVTAVGEGSFVGGVVGYNDGSVENCASDGSVTAVGKHGSAGGVVGYNILGSVENCASGGSVTAGGEGSFAGGVVGVNDEGSVENCASDGVVTAVGEESGAGGVVGGNSYGSVRNCMGGGSVMGKLAGGVVGWNDCSVENCASGGSVTAVGEGSSAGGVAGRNIGVVRSCASGGTVSFDERANIIPDVGVVVGDNDRGRVENCFYLEGSARGVVEGKDEPGAMPLSAEQFGRVDSFPGWDFENVWIMGPDGPVLRAARK